MLLYQLLSLSLSLGNTWGCLVPPHGGPPAQRAREGDGIQEPWPEQGASSLLCPRWGASFDGRVLGAPSPEIPHALDVGHLLSVGPPSVLSCDSGSGAVSWVLLRESPGPV